MENQEKIRIICLKVVLKRELSKSTLGTPEVQEEAVVIRFKAETSLKSAFDSVMSSYPKALFIEVYEPKSCSLTSDRI